MQIVDAHHHFWDLDRNYLPWLKDHPVKFRYGDYSALKRNYLPADYRRDSADFEIVGSVFVETEWDPTDPTGEVAWVEGVNREEGLPTVMVAQAWLDRDDAPAVLASHGLSPIVRGIRQKPRPSPSPEAVEAGARGTMGDRKFRAGYALLEPNGLSYDLQTPWWHLPEARALADDFPQTEIILNHTGLPADRSPEGIAGWRAAMRTLAGAPNAALKISGLGQAGKPWSADDNRRIVLDAIDIFGPHRVMFASNFPVDSLVGSFGTIFSGFNDITSGFPQTERDAMFRDNAKRIYRFPAQGAAT
jgi:predicted TIM-barrel fold metal-dependent hydrolase